MAFAFDFDDDVFIGREERVIVPQTAYTAKEDTDGWFHNDEDDYESVMQLQHGPNRIKSAIEHDYLYKRYDRALEAALFYINVVDHGHPKITNCREMVEIAVHCAARLEKYDLVEQLLDRKQTTLEIGTFRLRGLFYPACGRAPDAIDALVQYHHMRKHDYEAWTQMARIFAQEPGMGIHVAAVAIQRAIRVMTLSRWALSIPHVERRYTRNLDELHQLEKDIFAKGGDADQFKTWASAKERVSLDQMGLGAFKESALDWIYHEWQRHVSTAEEQDDQEDETRNVRDL